MVLESTIICLDNSEFSRNGDYFPTRLEAQKDAASILSTSRLESNPESTCGCISMAGNGVEVLVSPTADLGKYMAGLADINARGFCNLRSAIKIAQLALKHRQNKNGGQRIIMFVGSPIQESDKELVRIGKQLKKNNVALDIVSFGELDDNQAILEQLVEAANSADNSHLLTIPSGTHLTDVLRSSPLLGMDSGMGGGGMGGGGSSSFGGSGTTGGFEEYGGVNPELDPELAMALRMSAEEARAREESKNKEESEGSGGQGEQTTEEGGEEEEEEEGEEGEMDEEELLRQALAMSMGEGFQMSQDGQEDDEDAALQLALQMSLQQGSEEGSSSSSDQQDQQDQEHSSSSSSSEGFVDPAFVNQLLGSIEGVDMNDPLLQSAINAVTGGSMNEEEEQEGGEEEEEEEEGDKQT